MVPLPQMDGARRAGRGQLHYAAAITAGEVGVKPPTQTLIETLGAIDVGGWDNDDLELHVDHPSAGYVGRVFVADLCVAHCVTSICPPFFALAAAAALVIMGAVAYSISALARVFCLEASPLSITR